MSFFAGLRYTAQAAPPNPAAEVSRLLNSYSTHWSALERELKEVKAKQGQAQKDYQAGVAGAFEAKQKLMAAEEALAQVTAECEHVRQDIEAKQSVNSKVKAEADALQEEVAQLEALRAGCMKQLMEQCQGLVAQLRELKQANPGCFFKPAHIMES